MPHSHDHSHGPARRSSLKRGGTSLSGGLKKEIFFDPPNKVGRFQSLFLGALFGIFFFRLFLAFFLGFLHLDNKDHIFQFYLLGWILFPSFGISTAWLSEAVRRKWSIPPDVFYPLLLFLNFVLLLITLHPGQWSSFTGPSLAADFLIFQISAVSLSVVLKGREKAWKRIRGPEALYFMIVPLLGLWVLTLPWDWRDLLFPRSASGLLYFAGIMGVFYFGIPKNPGTTTSPAPARAAHSKPTLDIFFYALAFFATAYLVLDPDFISDRTHLAFYLGPLADMAAGKTLLVNINAQYGVLVFYFLRFFFHLLPLGYVSFTLLGLSLILLQYFLFYLIARQLFSSHLFAAFCLSGLLLLNHFLSLENFWAYYPSVGPLRFGFIYVLVALVVLRNRKPSWERPVQVLEAAVAATAFFWSLEVAIYTVPAYAGLVLCESAGLAGVGTGFNWASLKRRLGWFLAGAFLLGLFIYLYTFLNAHDWPHWGYYLDYPSAYRTGMGMIPTPGFGAWWIPIVVLYFSFFALLGFFFYGGKEARPPDLNVVALLTFYGITQFLYFLGRSHPNNLLHISMPAFLLLAYWLYQWRPGAPAPAPTGFQKGIFTLVVVLGGLCLSQIVPITIPIVKSHLLPPAVLWKRILLAAQDLPREDDFARRAGPLMEKYSGNRKSLVYFFGLRDLDVSLYLGKTEAYPYNDIIQADAFLPAKNRILAFDPGLEPGDPVYLSADLNQADYEYDFSGIHRMTKSTLEQQLLSGLRARFNFQLMENKDGIAVYRLSAKK